MGHVDLDRGVGQLIAGPAARRAGPPVAIAMARFLLRRLGLALVTLWLLSVIVFFGAQVLPGNVGAQHPRPVRRPGGGRRRSTRSWAPNGPLVSQYCDWIGGVLHGRPRRLVRYRAPGQTSWSATALKNSLKLALLAFVLVVPLGDLGGVIAALHEGRPLDRVDLASAASRSTAMPEFVSGIVLHPRLRHLARRAAGDAPLAPPGAERPRAGRVPDPARRSALVLVLFGYIARMARAGTVEALDADYTRTAVLKGLPRRTVIRRHVLRNALLPTIAVVATQTAT